MKPTDLDTIIALNNQLNSSENTALVDTSRIANPGVEVEGALTSFLTTRFEKIERDAEFTDLIRMHLRQRIPEASFQELMQLLHETSQDNNKAVESLIPLFKNEQSGKTVLDQLKDSSVESTAKNLYNATDSKDILQAVSYLSQVLGKLNDTSKAVIDVS